MKPLFVHGLEAARELVTALGLDPSRPITDVALKASCGGVAEVIVTYAMTTDQLEAASLYLKKFNLIEKEKQEPASNDIKFREFI